MYTIIDIEATNGRPSQQRIIEIALIRYDGLNELDRFSTLINPEVEIDSFVQKLTGITNKMVSKAPKFHEVARRIIEITQNSILVGHGVDFDYRLLRQSFLSLGYPFDMPKMDTLKLIEKAYPNLPQYGLKKICKDFGVVLTDHHRAFGDAQATLSLFTLLQSKEVFWPYMSTMKTNYSSGLSKQLKQQIDDLPHTSGVFYIFDSDNRLLYTSFAVNVSLEVQKCLFDASELANELLSKASKIQLSVCGHWLMAKLRFFNEIQRLTPLYAIPMPEIKFLYHFGWNGTHFKLTSLNTPIQLVLFRVVSLHQAFSMIHQFQQRWRISLSIVSKSETEFVFRLDQEGLNKTALTDDSNQAQWLTDSWFAMKKESIWVLEGKSIQEKDVIWIQDSIIKGYGTTRLHYQLQDRNWESLISPTMLQNDANESIINELFYSSAILQILIPDA